MKNLSKVYIFLLLSFVSLQTFAQKFGVQAGVNLSTMSWKDDDDTYSEDLERNIGFNAGVTMEMGFGNLMAVEIAALLDSKGFKISEGDDFIKANLLYADIPVLVKVGPSFGPVKIFGAVGPYVGIGLTGKVVMEFEGDKEKEDVQWGNGEEDDSKRLDYGAKFGVGAEFSGLNVGFYYSLGLANSSSDNENGYREQHRGISFSVGYRFGK